MKSSTLTFVSVLLVVVVCLFLWKDEIFKPKPVVVPAYENRILIINKKTGDTIFNKRIRSLSPMELDSLTLYLNTRK